MIEGIEGIEGTRPNADAVNAQLNINEPASTARTLLANPLPTDRYLQLADRLRTPPRTMRGQAAKKPDRIGSTPTAEAAITSARQPRMLAAARVICRSSRIPLGTLRRLRTADALIDARVSFVFEACVRLAPLKARRGDRSIVEPWMIHHTDTGAVTSSRRTATGDAVRRIPPSSHAVCAPGSVRCQVVGDRPHVREPTNETAVGPSRVSPNNRTPKLRSANSTVRTTPATEGRRDASPTRS